MTHWYIWIMTFSVTYTAYAPQTALTCLSPNSPPKKSTFVTTGNSYVIHEAYRNNSHTKKETSLDRPDEEVGFSFVLLRADIFKNCSAAIWQSCGAALDVVCEHLERCRIDGAPDLI